MKPRMLLLALAGCVGSAAFAGVVLANPTGTAGTGPSGAVAVQALTNLGGYLTIHDPVVPANNLPQRVDDVWAFEFDPDYAIEALSAAVTGQGSASGACTGISPTRFSFVATNLPSGDLLDGPVGEKIGELYVTIPPSVGNTCVVGGAVITITFQAIGAPPD